MQVAHTAITIFKNPDLTAGVILAPCLGDLI